MERPRKTEYFDFDLNAFGNDIAEQARLINEADLDEDESAQRLVHLANVANQLLIEQNLHGSPVLVPAGTRLPAIVDGEAVLSISEEPIEGQYHLLEVVSEGINEVGLRRNEIVHKVLISTTEINNPYMNYSFDRFALIPVDSQAPETLRHVQAYNTNERWLKSLLKPVYEAPNFDYDLLAAIYDRIKAAKYSSVPTEKNVDWYIDQLNEMTGIFDCPLNVRATKTLLQTPDTIRVYKMDSDIVLNGTVLGFCTMPKTELLDEAGEQFRVISGEDELGLCLETKNHHGTGLMKIPVRSIVAG